MTFQADHSNSIAGARADKLSQSTGKISTINSSIIRKKIHAAKYEALPHLKEKEAALRSLLENDKGTLDEAQTKAQLDALRRFIDTMQKEAIDMKRIAIQQRMKDKEFDSRELKKKQTKNEKEIVVNKIILQQIKEKTKQINDDLVRRKNNGIEGDKGYPPIPHDDEDDKRRNRDLASQNRKDLMR